MAVEGMDDGGIRHMVQAMRVLYDLMLQREESATLFRARIPALTNWGHQLRTVKEERNEYK